jgi:hypothetical protein
MNNEPVAHRFKWEEQEEWQYGDGYDATGAPNDPDYFSYEPLYTHLAKTLNFFEISIDDKYVIRIYKSGIYESELGNLSAKMPIEEWNEHAKNVKESE